MCHEAATPAAVTAQARFIHSGSSCHSVVVASGAGSVIAMSSLTHRRNCGAACQGAAAAMRLA